MIERVRFGQHKTYVATFQLLQNRFHLVGDRQLFQVQSEVNHIATIEEPLENVGFLRFLFFDLLHDAGGIDDGHLERQIVDD